MKILGTKAWVAGLGWGTWAVLGGLGCTPGYIKAESLEAKGQGPSACDKSCKDLGMRMTAMVLVGNSLPGCVCQPLITQPAAAAAPALDATPTPTPPAPPQSANDGAAASTTGYVVLAAAAAARQQQEQQRIQAQRASKN